jgi:hypothetical protein
MREAQGLADARGKVFRHGLGPVGGPLKSAEGRAAGSQE